MRIRVDVKQYFGMFFVVLALLAPSFCANMPFGVSPTRVEIDYTVDIGTQGTWAKIGGLPGNYPSGEVFDGKWDGIEISEISYSIDFWNVGEKGGESGMLFWKTDYSQAKLTIEYEVSGNGKIWKKAGNLGRMASYSFEEAPDPNFQKIVYNLRFTGGPEGSFLESAPYRGGAPLIGKIENGKVSFSQPAGANPPLGLAQLAGQKIPIPGNPFFGWTNSEEACEDSLAKFSDISRVVEIFPESNQDNIRSAKLHSTLCSRDHVTTGEESRATILFPDGSVLTMHEESEIIISPPLKGKTVLEHLSGRLKMNVKKVLAGESIEVKSNLATLGIKGTEFVSEVGEGEHVLKVIEGVVEFSNSKGVRTVKAGEFSTATVSAISQPASFDSVKEGKNWEKAGGFSPLVVLALVLVVFGGLGAVFLFKKKGKEGKHKKG